MTTLSTSAAQINTKPAPQPLLALVVPREVAA